MLDWLSPHRVNPGAVRLCCWPPPHAAASLHPPVAPPCGNQELPCVFLSPSETCIFPSSLLTEMEALQNSTRCRRFLLHDTVSHPSFTLQKTSRGSQSTTASIPCILLGFSCARTRSHRSSTHHRYHSSPLDRIRRFVAPSYAW
jgi:hypothetical protein